MEGDPQSVVDIRLDQRGGAVVGVEIVEIIVHHRDQYTKYYLSQHLNQPYSIGRLPQSHVFVQIKNRFFSHNYFIF